MEYVSSTDLLRKRFRVESDPGIEIAVLEVRPRRQGTSRVPVLLLHGARVPGEPSFDLDHPQGSLAGDLARAGHPVYVVDARGYGASTRPPAATPPEARGLVRTDAVVRDIAAVVAALQDRLALDRMAGFGWATGGHWLGAYAALYPDTISHIAFHNTLYGAEAPHADLGAGSALEDPRQPGRFHRQACNGYLLSGAESLLARWDSSIPLDDKARWRDPELVTAYVAAALASDPTSNDRDPPSFRAPSGAIEDAYYLACGRRFWDASLITAKALVVFSERDFWSRPADRDLLSEHLVNAASRETLTLPDATHFVHLDRPERGRDTLLSKLLAFLDA